MSYFLYGVATTLLVRLFVLLDYFRFSPVPNINSRVKFEDGGKKKIWFHVASVGEFRGILPLIMKFSEEIGCNNIILTTTSLTGLSEAKRLAPNIDARLAPIDVPRIVNRFLDLYQPELLIINETEIWPAILHESAKRNVRCILVNGRISDHTISKYKKLKFFFAPIIKVFKRIFVQSAKDRDRFIALGADPKLIVNVGSTKYDFPVPDSKGEFETWWSAISENLLFSDQTLFLAFGSIREEEEKIISECIELIFKKLRNIEVNPVVVIVPRHPERFVKFSQSLLENGFNVIKRSEDPAKFHKRFDASSGKVLLIDKMGELLEVYRKSDICFVGGTFSDVGGHNILEPAYFGKPILVGPNTGNVREVKQLLEEGGALVEVKTKDALVDAIFNLTFDIENNVRMGAKSHLIFSKLQGATTKIFESCKRVGLVSSLLCFGFLLK